MTDAKENVNPKADDKIASNDVTTLSFTRVTAYTKGKVLSSLNPINSRNKKRKSAKKSSSKKSTPVKAKITHIDPNSSIKRFLVKSTDTKSPEAIIPFGISSKSDAYHSKFPNYPWNKNDPLPVDLVMASAGDIGLKECENGF